MASFAVALELISLSGRDDDFTAFLSHATRGGNITTFEECALLAS
jgi:hypothetical protein